MPAPRPLLVYDGDCGFCRAWIARWRHATGERVEYAAYQDVAAAHPEIPLERFRQSVQLIEPDGRRSEGAEAVFRSLARAPGGGWPLRLHRHLPGFAPASEACYRGVAAHRTGLSRLTRLLWGSHLVPPGHALTAWIFLRLLAVVYGIAFVSLGVQVLGLAGSHGVLPAADFLSAVREQVGRAAYWDLPTVCWLDSSDRVIAGLCVAGAALSALLLAGIAPVLCLAGLWACYLSLAGVCQVFLWFQWDSLLLETGALAILLAPWRWWSRPGRDPEPPAGARWLLRWLLFRLMLSSAAVKLLSGDPTWRHLTALEYHYETQPLPPWTAWYAHLLPAGFQHMSAAIMFAVEGGAPFLVFGPRRVRFAAGAAIVGLQLLIVITGNYGFFNLLSLALCVPLLDDAVWPWRWRRPVVPEPPRAPRGTPWAWVRRPVVAALFALSLVPLFGALQLPSGWLGPLVPAYRLASPLHLADPYGLFAVMTTERPEIILEGSEDGATWRPYEFRYKPGDVTRRPAFVAPHMPRLDWQMWFAALGDARREPWVLSLCRRLLQGDRTVLALLANDPFPGSAPRYVRATVYDYRFTDAATRRRTGAWWSREPRGLYCPVLMLEGDHLVAAPGQEPRP